MTFIGIQKHNVHTEDTLVTVKLHMMLGTVDHTVGSTNGQTDNG